MILIENQNLELPDCDNLGNFPPQTCRRGICYCIDDDGLPYGKEVLEIKASELNCE